MRILPVLVLATIIVWSCTDVPDEQLSLQPTEMEVTVYDENVDAVEGAVVSIYRDYYSFKQQENQIASGITDESGKVLFSDLEPRNYYVYASHQEGDSFHDNSDDFFILYDVLTENAVTRVSVKTAYSRPVEPTDVSLLTIQLIPVDADTWSSTEFDTLYTLPLLIKNYDAEVENPFDQEVVSEDYADFTKKPKFGEGLELFYFNDIEINIEDLENSGDTYSFVLVWFQKEDDRWWANSIFAGEQEAEGTYEVMYPKDVATNIKSAVGVYPAKASAGQISINGINYRVYLDLQWK